MIIRRDVTFNETDFEHQKQVVNIEVSTDVDVESAAEDCGNQEMCCSQRAMQGTLPIHFGFDEDADLTVITHVALCAAVHEPSSLQEALESKYLVQNLQHLSTALCSGKMLQIPGTSH